MGTHSGPHRKIDLGQFLLSLLDEGNTHGLQWIDRDLKRFKIPWPDKRNRVWANVENVITKKWEICGGRFKEGSPENWSNWKQTFRGALNKSPFVRPVPELHQEKNPTMPYRVYEFTDAINRSENNSCSTKRKKCKRSSSNSKGMERIEVDSDIGSCQWKNSELHSPHKCNKLIPQVVLEELTDSSYSNDLTVNPVTNAVNNCVDVSPCPSNLHQVPFSAQDSMEIEIIDFLNSPLVCTGRGNNSPSAIVHHGDDSFGKIPPTPASAIVYHGDDRFGIVPTTPASAIVHHGDDSFGKIPPTPASAIVYHGDDRFGIVPTTPEAQFDRSPVSCPNNQASPVIVGNGISHQPYVRFQAFYFNHLKVLEGCVTDNGVSLFFDQTMMNRLKKGNIQPHLWDRIRGPDYFRQVELPDPTRCGQNLDGYDSETRNQLKKILDSMRRPVLLFYLNRKLFVYRLCRSHVIASYGKEGHLTVDRKNKSEQQIFCMETFESQLNLYKRDPQKNPCPSPTVTLTFGTEPGTKPLVHLELTVLEAETLLRGETTTNGRGNGDVLLSGFDSVDLLVENFNQSMTMNGNIDYSGCYETS